MHANSGRPALVGRAVGGRDRLNSSGEDRDAKAPGNHACCTPLSSCRIHLAIA